MMPQVPAYVAGLLDYRGNPVPVIDLCQLIIARPTIKALSSRIILVNYTVNNQTPVLGIIGEKVTETCNLPDEMLKDTGITMENARYLGPVANIQNRMIQYIEVNSLLTEEAQAILFQNQIA